MIHGLKNTSFQCGKWIGREERNKKKSKGISVISEIQSKMISSCID
jgi:hypothetical protein